MTDSYIEVRDVWKKFRRGELHDSLRDLVPHLARRLLGRAPGTDQLEQGDFWALRGLTFDVRPGQALGVIGPNGAGKSTLLKLVTRVLRPTRGYCHIEGRVGALIEVAAGFHPDLTGRENVFLQGAIMGMKQAHIRRKFDEIVAFSGVEEFIDTPVKRYSSGMNARLGFAIAAHLDPDVLIIDEVLAVGDFAFQQRAFDRIGDLARSGIPVIVVSHQLDRIAALCTEAILLNHGEVVRRGTPGECITTYMEALGRLIAPASGYPLSLRSIALVSPRPVRSGEWVRLRVAAVTEGYDRDATDTLSVRLRNLQTGALLFATGTGDFGLRLPDGDEFEVDFELQMNVPPGLYSAESYMWDHTHGKAVLVGPAITLEVEEGVRFWGSVQLNPRVSLRAALPAGPSGGPAS